MSIPGDPAGVEEAARVLGAAGRAFTDAAGNIASHGRAVTTGWTGAAADAAADAITALANRTLIGAEVCAGAGPVLTAYAAALRAAQREYQVAADAAAAGTSAEHAARVAAATAQALGATDPTRPGALAAAASATSEAGDQVRAAHASMADAVAAAQRADTEAARAVDALAARLDAMDAMDAAPTTAGTCTGVSPLDRPYHGDLYNGFAGFMDGVWGATVGTVEDVAVRSPFKDDRQYGRAIQAAHDWLQDWYGADSSSTAYRDTYLGVQIASLGVGEGEARGAGEVAAHAGGDWARVKAAGERGFDIGSLAFPAPATYCGRPVVEETSGAQGRGWNQALGNPAPDTTYVVDHRQVYVTDHQGRVVHVEADLHHLDDAAAGARRHEGDQAKAGGPDRLTGDEGGHLVASSLGGPGERINLVPMSKDLNGSAPEHLTGTDPENWHDMEAQLRGELKNPGTDIRFDVDVRYPAGGLRPDDFRVSYTATGKAPEFKEFSQ